MRDNVCTRVGCNNTYNNLTEAERFEKKQEVKGILM